MIHRVIVLLVVGLLAAAASLSATLASADTTGDLARIAGTAQALTKAGSAKIAGTVQVGGAATAPSSTSGTEHFTGAFDFKHRTGRITIDASALGTTRSTAKIQFLLVKGVAYISLESIRRLANGQLPSTLSGKKWLRFDAKALGASGNQLSQADPSSTLGTLGGVTGDVQNLGSETVRGAATTHYRIHIDLAQAVQKAPAARRAQVQQVIQALGGSGVLPADIWIDRQDRPRKFSLDFMAKTGTTSVSASESFEFSDFGAAVSVAAPPSNQTADFSQLFGGLGGSTPSTS